MRSSVSCAACHRVRINADFRIRGYMLPNIRNASVGQTRWSLSLLKSEVAFHYKDFKDLLLCSRCLYCTNNNLLCISHLLLNLIYFSTLLYSWWFFCAQPTSIILFHRSLPVVLTFIGLFQSYQALNNVSSAYFLFWKWRFTSFSEKYFSIKLWKVCVLF